MIRGKRDPVIHVIAFKKNAETPIEVRVTPDILDMTQFAKGAQVIRWKLDTTGFHFPVDGSAIEFTTPGAETSFGKVEVDRCARIAAVRNRNRDGLAYAYTIRVIEKVSGTLIELDPAIGNNIP